MPTRLEPEEYEYDYDYEYDSVTSPSRDISLNDYIDETFEESYKPEEIKLDITEDELNQIHVPEDELIFELAGMTTEQLQAAGFTDVEIASFQYSWEQLDDSVTDGIDCLSCPEEDEEVTEETFMEEEGSSLIFDLFEGFTNSSKDPNLDFELDLDLSNPMRLVRDAVKIKMLKTNIWRAEVLRKIKKGTLKVSNSNILNKVKNLNIKKKMGKFTKFAKKLKKFDVSKAKKVAGSGLKLVDRYRNLAKKTGAMGQTIRDGFKKAVQNGSKFAQTAKKQSKKIKNGVKRGTQWAKKYFNKATDLANLLSSKKKRRGKWKKLFRSKRSPQGKQFVAKWAPLVEFLVGAFKYGTQPAALVFDGRTNRQLLQILLDTTDRWLAPGVGYFDPKSRTHFIIGNRGERIVRSNGTVVGFVPHLRAKGFTAFLSDDDKLNGAIKQANENPVQDLPSLVLHLSKVFLLGFC